MRPAPNPVTEFDAAHFQYCVEEWQKKLNLMDWRIVRSKRKTTAMADVTVRLPHKLASYAIGKDFGGTPVNEHTIEVTAVHELLHVLLAELIEVASTEGHTTDQLWAAEHGVINALLNVLVPKE